jgi:outer membrane protein TolC
LALSGSDGVADGAVSVEQVTVSFEPILLGQVLDQVRQHNAALAVAQSDIQVAQGRRRQAGLLSNPELELEVEEMATNEFGDFGKSINTFSITQEIQTAGRRQTARAIADAEVEISSIEYQVLEREVLTKATKAFFVCSRPRVAAKRRAGLWSMPATPHRLTACERRSPSVRR